MPDDMPEPALTADRVREQVQAGVRATAAWAWRLLLIALLGYATLQIGLRLGRFEIPAEGVDSVIDGLTAQVLGPAGRRSLPCPPVGPAPSGHGRGRELC